MPPGIRYSKKEQVNSLQGRVKFLYTADFSVYNHKLVCKHSTQVPNCNSHLFPDLCRSQVDSSLFSTRKITFCAMVCMLCSLTRICKIWGNELSCWRKSVLGKGNPLIHRTVFLTQRYLFCSVPKGSERILTWETIKCKPLADYK